jgi:hypothetical protein
MQKICQRINYKENFKKLTKISIKELFHNFIYFIILFLRLN